VSLVAVYRIPAPRGEVWGPNAWDAAVGKSHPVRVAAVRAIDGWLSTDAICTAVEVAQDGRYADLTLSVFVDDPALVLGMFVPSEMISIREGE